MFRVSSEFAQVIPGLYVLSEDETALTLVGKCDAFLGPEWWAVWCRLVDRLRKVEKRCRIGRLPDWRLRGLYTGAMSSLTPTETAAQSGLEPPLYAPWDRHAASTYRGWTCASSFLPWLWHYREQFQCRKRRLRRRRTKISPTQYMFDPHKSWAASGVQCRDFARATYVTQTLKGTFIGGESRRSAQTAAKLTSFSFRDMCVLRVCLHRAAGGTGSLFAVGGHDRDPASCVPDLDDLFIWWPLPGLRRLHAVIQNQLGASSREQAPPDVVDMVRTLDYDITDVHQWLVMCDWLEERLDANVRAALERSLRDVRDVCHLIAQLSNEY